MRAIKGIAFVLALMGVAWSCTGNLNEPEVGNQFFTIDENLSAGTIFGVVDAYDLDNGTVLSYGILEGNEGGTFEIDSHGGHLSVADPALLNYELNEKIKFTVVVSDNGDPVMESTATMTVSLNDLNEFAPVVEDQSFEIQAGATEGTEIGVIQASDEEAHQLLLYSILSGNDNDQVAIDDETGSLTVKDLAAFETASDQPLELTVLVRDMHIDSKTDSAIIHIFIIP
ncbi:MAG: cadherin repeat domain-containing protein [Bacteroidetes bacterium]|nr:cadherin repeat domain-containing protein [Bacteroidota bacterium]